MNHDDWVTVERTPLEVVAEMMRGRLEAEGIEATLRGNRASSTAGVINELNTSWANPLGGVEVRVRGEDEARAREVLAVDDREPAEQRRDVATPSWVQWIGAYIVAQLTFYAVQSVTANAIFAVGAALFCFVAVLWIGGRVEKGKIR